MGRLLGRRYSNNAFDFVFLKDSLETKIKNRFKKLQRKRPQGMNTSVEDDKVKGSAGKKKNVDPWAAVPLDELDDDSINDLKARINTEWKKTRKEHAVIQDLMAQTYPSRRAMILEDGARVDAILQEYPPLANMLYVSTFSVTVSIGHY